MSPTFSGEAGWVTGVGILHSRNSYFPERKVLGITKKSFYLTEIGIDWVTPLSLGRSGGKKKAELSLSYFLV